MLVANCVAFYDDIEWLLVPCTEASLGRKGASPKRPSDPRPPKLKQLVESEFPSFTARPAFQGGQVSLQANR